jgi:hypothetical protein
MATTATRVCLVTTGQPACNPRLVKEADTLVDAGFDVHIVAAFSADWATDADRELASSRRWSQTFIDWRLTSMPWTFWKSRLRHSAARLTAPWLGASSAAEFAVSRIAPELRRAASKVQADLYIAHNLGALPAAWRASRRHGAKLGFDAEDFHSGQLARDDRMRPVIDKVEREYLPACDYVTASAPGIAEAYAALTTGPAPGVVLNVFPKSQRPGTAKMRVPSAPLTLYWFSQTIGPGRGLEDIVCAMARTPAEATVLHLRGDWCAGYESSLRGLAAEQGVVPERIVAHALAAPDEMIRRSATYDIGLALEPGTNENNDLSISNKLFTYLLAGQAILATRTRGQGWLLDQISGAALAYDPGDAETLAGHLRRWIAQPAALVDARQTSWDYGDRRFNWDVEQARFLNLIRRTLGEAATRARARNERADPAATRAGTAR